MKDWPYLSKTLRFERHPECCQSCGNGPATGEELQRWLECDDQDKPTTTVVMLCAKCADRLIEPHPRLYDKQPRMGPWPGAMPICSECDSRWGLDCICPLLKSNGGPGMNITVPEPTRGFWDGRDKSGKRTGGTFVSYPHHPQECAGRTPK